MRLLCWVGLHTWRAVRHIQKVTMRTEMAFTVDMSEMRVVCVRCGRPRSGSA